MWHRYETVSAEDFNTSHSARAQIGNVMGMDSLKKGRKIPAIWETKINLNLLKCFTVIQKWVWNRIKLLLMGILKKIYLIIKP